MIQDNLKMIAIVITSIMTIGGAYVALEGRISSVATNTVEPVARSVSVLDKRVRLAELRDLHQKALDDYYHWKNLHEKYPSDKEIKRSLDRAKARVEDLERRIEELEKELEE